MDYCPPRPPLKYDPAYNNWLIIEIINSLILAISPGDEGFTFNIFYLQLKMCTLYTYHYDQQRVLVHQNNYDHDWWWCLNSNRNNSYDNLLNYCEYI